jgi:hypothetical protein
MEKAFMNRILCISLFLALATHGQQQERIAVMHTVDDLDSVSVTDLGYLTDRLRDIASKVLPKSRYGIMTQQSIVDRLGSQERAEKECREATCLADLGRKISADYISQGRIGRFSGELTIKVELYSVGSGTLLGAVTGDSKDLRGLLAIIEAKAPKLFEDMQKVPSSVPVKPVPPPPVPKPVPDSAVVLLAAPAAVDSPAVPLKLDPLVFSAQDSVPAAAPAAKKECANKFNINELVFKIESSFSGQLKDCSAALAKNMALAMSPFGKKAEQKEPKAFMTDCVIDGIKQKLPAGAEEYVKPVEGFLQNLLNAASAAGGGLDVKMLSGLIGGMDASDLVKEIKIKAFKDDCAVNEPYELPAASGDEEEEGPEEKKGKRRWSLGLRAGLSASHMYAEYSNDYYHGSGTYESGGWGQGGLVFDWAFSDWFHIQPGFMIIRKGTLLDEGESEINFTYFEIPLLLSLKFSVFRVNAGPYFGICVDDYVSRWDGYGYNDKVSPFDFGISTGFGFDIWKFYIGMFYDYGLTKVYSFSYHEIGNNINIKHSFKAYNRTLGFNLGVNL